MRFNFHVSFISVVAGALLFAPPSAPLPIPEILKCYFLFNVLLYGGIYTFNDIVDISADAIHETKKNRPLPSGQIGIRRALLFCVFLLGTSLFLSWLLFPREFMLTMIGFLAANAAYTLLLKRVPYAGLSIVAMTHTLRLVIGMLIAGAPIDVRFCAAFYAMLFCIAVTIHGHYNVTQQQKIFYSKPILNGCQLCCAALIASLAYGSKNFSPPWMILLATFTSFILATRCPFLRRPISLIFMTQKNHY